MYLKIDESQVEIFNRVLLGKTTIENVTPQTKALGAVISEVSGKISDGDVVISKRVKNSGKYSDWKEIMLELLEQGNINPQFSDMLFIATVNRVKDGIGDMKTMRIDNSPGSPLIGEQIQNANFSLNADYIISVFHHTSEKYGIYMLIGTDDQTEAEIAAEIERERIDREIRMESMINAMIAAG